jgi:carbamoyl-phosphate synthase large subunit
MKSTGEVMGIDAISRPPSPRRSLARARAARGRHVFVSVKDSDKPVILPAVRQSGRELGFTHHRDGRHAAYLADAGVPVERVNKVAEGRPHIVDKIIDGECR